MEKPEEERVYTLSGAGFKNIAETDGSGKNFHWTTGKKVEMPIH